MGERPLPIVFVHRAVDRQPARVQAPCELQRDGDRHLHIGQRREFLLVVCRDERVFFRQRQLEANERVHVTVRDVMHDLPDRPASRTIRSIELRVVQTEHRRC